MSTATPDEASEDGGEDTSPLDWIRFARRAAGDLSNIIISQHMAKAIFGTEDPMNKTVQVKLNKIGRAHV